VHLAGAKGGTTLDLTIGKDTATGSVTEGGLTGQLLAVGGTTYIKGDKAFWDNASGVGSGDVLAGLKPRGVNEEKMRDAYIASLQFAGDGPGPRCMVPHVKNVILASADQVAIDAVAAKMVKTARKYPVQRCRGRYRPEET
jgi:hypothetical protein